MLTTRVLQFIMRTAAAALAVAAAAAVVSACGTGSGNTPAAEEKELRIYNWADYIGKDTLADSRPGPASR